MNELKKKILILSLTILCILFIIVILFQNKDLIFIKKGIDTDQKRDINNEETTIPADEFSQKVYAMLDKTDMVLEGTITVIENNTLMISAQNRSENNTPITINSETLLFRQPATYDEPIRAFSLEQLKKGVSVLIYASPGSQDAITAVGIGIRAIPETTHIIEFKPKEEN